MVHEKGGLVGVNVTKSWCYEAIYCELSIPSTVLTISYFRFAMVGARELKWD